MSDREVVHVGPDIELRFYVNKLHKGALKMALSIPKDLEVHRELRSDEELGEMARQSAVAFRRLGRKCGSSALELVCAKALVWAEEHESEDESNIVRVIANGVRSQLRDDDDD